MAEPAACAEIRELIPDLVAGAVSAADRARMDGHVAACAGCRRAVDDALAMAGELLGLIPEREPPAGFDAAVLGRLSPPAAAHPGRDGIDRDRPVPARTRRDRTRRALLAAAAGIAVAALAGGAVWRATADDRMLADGYRDTLAVADGQYFLAWKLRAADGSPAGVVYAYQGRPSWVFITVTAPGSYEVRLRTRAGTETILGSFSAASWGSAIDAAVHDLAEIRLSQPGSADLVAVVRFPPGLG